MGCCPSKGQRQRRKTFGVMEDMEYSLMEDDGNASTNHGRDSVLGLRGKPAPQSLGYARLQVNFVSPAGSGETLDLKQGETVKVLHFDGDGSETVYIVTLQRDRPEQYGMIPTHLLHLVGNAAPQPPVGTQGQPKEEQDEPQPVPPPVDYNALYSDNAAFSDETRPSLRASPAQESGRVTRSRSESTETAIRNAKYEAAKAAAANAMAALLEPDEGPDLMD